MKAFIFHWESRSELFDIGFIQASAVRSVTFTETRNKDDVAEHHPKFPKECEKFEHC